MGSNAEREAAAREEEEEGADKDFQYQDFLKSLRYQGKSYVVKLVVDGLPTDVKCEGREISDEECDHDLNKRSARERSNGFSNGSPSTYLSEEAENLSRRISRKKVRRETLIPDEIVDEGCDHDLNKRIPRSARKRSNGLSNGSQSTYPSEEAENLSPRISRKKVRRETLIPNEIVDEGCGHDLNKRILRSARKITNGISNGSQSTYLSEEAENLSRRNSRKKVRRETLTPDEIVEDPDYAAFLRGCTIVGDQPVYADGHYTNRGESGGQDDEWAPHVEFLDRATFYKEEFRSQLNGVLRKPYDKEEDENLYEAIDKRELEKRHKDLRYGREKSCSTDKYGKSYLDHHPDLREQLAQLDGDGPKRLNLLRGFFFWLKKASHGGSFLPWKDKKCLAIIPESG